MGYKRKKSRSRPGQEQDGVQRGSRTVGNLRRLRTIPWQELAQALG